MINNNKNKEFDKWWNSLDDEDAYRQCKPISEKSWNACKEKILELFSNHQLGVGTYGLNERTEGVIHRIEVMDKIRKL
jgi:hypothetical protein